MPGVIPGEVACVFGRATGERLLAVERLVLALPNLFRDELLEVEVVLGTAPEDTIWLEHLPDASPEQRAAFEAWSSGRWPPAG